MPKFVFITDCPGGYCECTEEEMEPQEFINEKGKKSPRKVCKEHGGLILQKKGWCSKCGAVFYTNAAGNMSEYCPTCRGSHKREVAVNYKREARKTQAELKAAAEEYRRAANCPWYDNICGYPCIRPYFTCRRYEAYQRRLDVRRRSCA